MPERLYSLEPGGPKRLSLSWVGSFEDLDVRLDGQRLGGGDGLDAVRAGLTMALPDGGELRVQYRRPWFWPELAVLRDGAPLPGSDTDPHQRVRQCAWFAVFLSVATLLASALATAGSEALSALGYGWASLLDAAIWGVIAWHLWRERRWAWFAGVGLYALDTVFGLVLAFQHRPSIGGSLLAVRLFWTMFWARGWWGLQTLRGPN